MAKPSSNGGHNAKAQTIKPSSQQQRQRQRQHRQKRQPSQRP
jgi:hypothetical protein